MEHLLKTHPEPFEAVCSGVKHHEVRVFDRPYKVGDTLKLELYIPPDPTPEGNMNLGGYQGPWARVLVTHITQPGTWGLPEDVGVMSVQLLAMSHGKELDKDEPWIMCWPCKGSGSIHGATCPDCEGRGNYNSQQWHDLGIKIWKRGRQHDTSRPYPWEV